MSSDQQRVRTAFHEAGHAIASSRFGYEPGTVTIVPANDSSGSASAQNPLRGINLETDDSPDARHRAEQMVVIFFAGPLAERLIAPRSNWRRGAEEDFGRAAELLIVLGGYDDEHRRLYERLLLRRTELILDEHWQCIEVVADALLKHCTLSGDQVKALLAGQTTEFPSASIKAGALAAISNVEGR